MPKRVMVQGLNGICKIDPNFCPHEYTKLVSWSQRYISDGELIERDNETVICLDCGKELSEKSEVKNDELEF